MWFNMSEREKEDFINTSGYFEDCQQCGQKTSKDKLAEFNGICEDCYYENKQS